MIHHLRAAGTDTDDLAEMRSLLHKTVLLLALALDEIVVSEETVLGNVPAMDGDRVLSRVTVETVAGSSAACCTTGHCSELAII